MKRTGYRKRILSLALAAALAVSLCAPAWAEEADPDGSVSSYAQQEVGATSENGQSDGTVTGGDAQQDENAGEQKTAAIGLNNDVPALMSQTVHNVSDVGGLKAALESESVQDGDTIVLAANTYDVGSLTIKKAVNLQGAGADKTVLKGTILYGNTSDTDINSATVTVQGIGFDTQNQMSLCFSTGVTNSTLTIADCSFANSNYAVNLNTGATGNTLTLKNTTFTGTWCAIAVKDGNTVNTENVSVGEGVVFAVQKFASPASQNNKYYFDLACTEYVDANKETVTAGQTFTKAAAVGAECYSSFADAFANVAENSTITLYQDVALDQMLNVESDGLRLNLNNHIITAADSFNNSDKNSSHLINVTGQYVVIENGKLVGTSKSRHNIQAYSGGTLTLKDVVLDHSAATGAPLMVNSANVTLEGNIKFITGTGSWYNVNVDSNGSTASLTFAADAKVTLGDALVGIQVDRSTADNLVTLAFGYGAQVTGSSYPLVLNTQADNHPSEVMKVTGLANSNLEEPQIVGVVAKIDDVYYPSLDKAFAAAADGKTITLLADADNVSKLVLSDGRTITVNLNGHDVAFESYCNFQIRHGTLNLEGAGTAYEKAPYYAPVMVYGTTANEENYSVVNVGKDVTLRGWSSVFIDKNGNYANGVVANVAGTLQSVKDTTDAYGHAVYVQGLITNVNDTYAPQIHLLSTARVEAVDEENSTKGSNGMYLAGYAVTTIDKGAFIQSGAAGIEIRAGKLTVNGGTIESTAIPTTITPNGNGSTTEGAALAVSQHTTALPLEVTINGGTFSGYTALYENCVQDSNRPDLVKVTVNDGNFAATNGGVNSVYADDPETMTIYGGYFTADPSEYLAKGKAAVASNLDGYLYMVGRAGDNPAVVVEEKPAETGNAVANNPSATEQDKELANEIYEKLKNLTVQEDVLQAEVKTVANNNTVTAEDGLAELKKQGVAGDTVKESAVTIVVQPYLSMEVRGVETPAEDESAEGRKTFTLDITPMYRTVATTANVAANDDIIVKGEEEGETANAVVMGEPAKLNVTKPVEMTIQLPSDFAEEGTTLYVLHQKEDGRRYQYAGTVDSMDVLTFTNPNGFSVFTVSTQKFDLSTDDTTDSGNTTTTPAATPAPTAAPQQSGSNITYYTCQACGYHDWTATAEGYKCNHCGYIESVKQLSGYGNVKGVYEPKTSTAAAQTGAAASGTVSSAIPQTGDEQPIAALVVVAVAALLGLGVTVVMKKRNNG